MKKTLRLWVMGGFGGILLVGAIYLTHPHLKPSASHPSLIPPSTTLRGTAVEGAVLTSMDSQGQSLTLKIQDVEPDSKDPERDVYLYTVGYQNSTNSQWQNVCQPDRDGIAKAIPLSGQWDSKGNYVDNGRVTFACTNSALAKCVRWGYKPWKKRQGQSLRDLHQACTRMVRADYCGTGVAHTQDGTPIDVYDRLGIQKRVETSGMKFEAAWKPNGAVAISRTRFPETLAQIQRECPDRLKPFQSQDAENRDLSLSALQKYAPEAVIFNDSVSSRN